ncbi:hypothetical protein ABIB85_006254 [Bradyrhizobium sp. JR1.5]|uniref:hypothetical protein n=1 Tax=unclassified Bradyrhizobium TaxID=2631580 RepID=UPI00339620DE
MLILAARPITQLSPRNGFNGFSVLSPATNLHVTVLPELKINPSRWADLVVLEGRGFQPGMN